MMGPEIKDNISFGSYLTIFKQYGWQRCVTFLGAEFPRGVAAAGVDV